MLHCCSRLCHNRSLFGINSREKQRISQIKVKGSRIDLFIVFEEILDQWQNASKQGKTTALKILSYNLLIWSGYKGSDLREGERKRESAEPWNQQVSVMSEKGGLKGRDQLSWNSCNTYLASDRQEGALFKEAVALWETQSQRILYKPGRVQEVWIRGKKKNTVSLLSPCLTCWTGKDGQLSCSTCFSFSQVLHCLFGIFSLSHSLCEELWCFVLGKTNSHQMCVFHIDVHICDF